MTPASLRTVFPNSPVRVSTEAVTPVRRPPTVLQTYICNWMWRGQ